MFISPAFPVHQANMTIGQQPGPGFPSGLAPILRPSGAGRIECRPCPKSHAQGQSRALQRGSHPSLHVLRKPSNGDAETDTTSPNPTCSAKKPGGTASVEDKLCHFPKGMLASESPSWPNSRGQCCVAVGTFRVWTGGSAPGPYPQLADTL